jgi:hypothetical protein
MNWPRRMPDLVIVVLVVVLGVGGILVGKDSPDGTGSGSGASAAQEGATVTPRHIALIERRVERLRRLRFERPVPVAVVSPAQARREGIAEYDTSQPVGERRVNEELLKLLGLLPPDADVRQIEATIYGEQVAGYYDPRRGRLALVRGAGVDDITLAHELTHALEDQHFDLDRLGEGVGDDATTAQQALVEGTATLVMQHYALRWPGAAPIGDALAGLSQVTSGTPLPPYTLRTMLFPYLSGERFAERLLATSGDWRLVDVALRHRPPATTAEILDPERWIHAERPAPVSLGGAAAAAALPRLAGWRRIAGSTLGEEDLAALLAGSSGQVASRELTAGWRGGRYALWRRGPLDDPDCAAPCRARDALVLVVRTDSAVQARALAAAIGAWQRSLPPGSAGAVSVSRTTVRAALAPDAALSRRLLAPARPAPRAAAARRPG